MNRELECFEACRQDSDLSCFEYVDVYGEKKSFFQCFCSCDALDTACDRVLSCDFTSSSTFNSGKSCFSMFIHNPCCLKLMIEI